MRDDSNMTYAEMNVKLAGMPADDQAFMRPISEKSIFATQWTLRVLR